MKRFKIITIAMFLSVTIVACFYSCVKKDNFFTSDSNSSGKAVVKIIGGDSPAALSANFIDFVNTSQTVLAIDLRRDPASQANLSTTMTVVVKDDTAAVRATDPSFQAMPSSWYTLVSEAPRTGGSGGTYTFTFQPGEFAKQVYIVIPNATLLNPSVTYAWGFTITSIAGDGIISTSKSEVVTIGAKNEYDGVYDDNFTNYHPTSNPSYTGDDVEVYLITTGANKCKIYSPDLGGYYNPAVLSGSLTAFGAQEPEYTIDLTTNVVTVQNAAAGAVTFYSMAAGFNSHYDPATRTIYCKFGYNYDPGAVFNPSTTREWTQTLKYLRPR